MMIIVNNDYLMAGKSAIGLAVRFRDFRWGVAVAGSGLLYLKWPPNFYQLIWLRFYINIFTINCKHI